MHFLRPTSVLKQLCVLGGAAERHAARCEGLVHVDRRTVGAAALPISACTRRTAVILRSTLVERYRLFGPQLGPTSCTVSSFSWAPAEASACIASSAIPSGRVPPEPARCYASL